MIFNDAVLTEACIQLQSCEKMVLRDRENVREIFSFRTVGMSMLLICFHQILLTEKTSGVRNEMYCN